MPADRMKEFLRRRIEHDADLGHAIDHQRGGNRPLGHMTQESVSAIDRVDHPHAIAGESLLGVLGFLREPTISGPRRAEFEFERGVDGKIGLADLAAVGLLLHADWLTEIAERKRPRSSHGGLEQRVVLVERRQGLRLWRGQCGHLLTEGSLNHVGSKACAYQTLNTSIKRIGKLLGQDRSNQGGKKAAP